MINEWMNDCLIIYIEIDYFNNIDNEAITQCFQKMKNLLKTIVKTYSFYGTDWLVDV